MRTTRRPPNPAAGRRSCTSGRGTRATERVSAWAPGEQYGGCTEDGPGDDADPVLTPADAGYGQGEPQERTSVPGCRTACHRPINSSARLTAKQTQNTRWVPVARSWVLPSS